MFTLFCFVFVVSLYPVIYLTSVCVTMYVSIADFVCASVCVNNNNNNS